MCFTAMVGSYHTRAEEACPWTGTEAVEEQGDTGCRLDLSCSESGPKKDGHVSCQLDSLAFD